MSIVAACPRGRSEAAMDAWAKARTQRAEFAKPPRRRAPLPTLPFWPECALPAHFPDFFHDAGRYVEHVGDDLLHFFAGFWRERQLERAGLRPKIRIDEHPLKGRAQQREPCRWDMGRREQRAADFIIRHQMPKHLVGVLIPGQFQYRRDIAHV